MELPFEAVENISKPLASVAKMLDSGHAVLYHPKGSAIFNLRAAGNSELEDILGRVASNSKYTKIPLQRENDVFNFELAVDVAASKAANAGEQHFRRQR